MPIHPVVHALLWIGSIACILYPIIPLIKYDAEVRKIQQEFIEEMEEEIRKFKADPKNYKAKRY
jgi:hypothetical protein